MQFVDLNYMRPVGEFNGVDSVVRPDSKFLRAFLLEEFRDGEIGHPYGFLNPFWILLKIRHPLADNEWVICHLPPGIDNCTASVCNMESIRSGGAWEL